MLGIIKKNSGYYLIVILILAYPTLYEFLEGVNNIHAFPKLLGALMYFAVIVPAMMNETQEEKHRGYNFLATLPVTVRETVTAKFLLMLAAVIFVTGYDAALLAATGSSARFVLQGVNYLVWNASICLIVGALMFLAVYRFGAVSAMMGILTATFGANILTFLAFRAGKDYVGKLLSWGSFIEEMSPALAAAVFAAGIAGFFWLMTVAVKVKERRRIA